MVKLNKIYTRTGDKGQTGLGNGARVPKHDLRVAAYGTVDEADAALGVARCYADDEWQALLGRLQNDLFDVGADLCTPEQAEPPDPPLRVSPAQVTFLESEVDRLNTHMAALRSFVLPGGTPLAAHLHLARTITRRAERLISQVVESAPEHLEALRYMNRLSDLLFVVARAANDNGESDVLWVPGANQVD